MNTIIEKIRAEVLRIIRESDCSQYGLGKMSACNRILNFLDTLQEQPVCDGLEEEMEKFIETFGWGKTKHLAEKELISATARHFAQWQKEQMMKEAVEERVVDAGIFATYNTPVEYTHSGDKVKIIIIKED